MAVQRLSQRSIWILRHQPCFAGLSDEFDQTGSQPLTIWIPLVRGQNSSILRFTYKELAPRLLVMTVLILAKTSPVFAAMGITFEEAEFFVANLETGPLTVLFINPANDPAIERRWLDRLDSRRIRPMKRHFNVLVIMTDMTNYCEGLLLEASACRKFQVVGATPGCLYTKSLNPLLNVLDACWKERSDQIPIPCQKMIHHPIPYPDLTGYITEGQIILSSWSLQ